MVAGDSLAEHTGGSISKPNTHISLCCLDSLFCDVERPDVVNGGQGSRGTHSNSGAAFGARRYAPGGAIAHERPGFLENKTPLQRWLRLAPMRWLFPDLDLIIGVSEGVVEDTLKITGLPRERMVRPAESGDYARYLRQERRAAGASVAKRTFSTGYPRRWPISRKRFSTLIRLSAVFASNTIVA